MSPTGPNNPTAASSASGAGVAWTNPTNAEASDAVYTTAVLSSSTTNNLNTSSYNFAIPSTAIIDGIFVQFQRYGSGISTHSIQLLKAGSLAGTAITTGLDSWPAAENYISYGGSTNLWGTTWLPSDINNSGFGVAISATGTGTAHIDVVTITIYWHTAPTTVFKEYMYKSFSPSGQYLGLLPVPSSDPAFSQDINNAGSQTTITVPKSADTSNLAVDNLTDESGNLLTDEGSNQLTDEGQMPIYLPSSYSGNALIKNGNLIQIWVVNYWHPQGKCIFLGIMENCSATFGGEDLDDSITIVAYGDGEDLDNFMVYSPDLVIDQQNTSQNDYQYSIDPTIFYGYYFTVGAGVTNLTAISMLLGAVGSPNYATVYVFNNDTDAHNNVNLLTSATLLIQPGEVEYQFIFPSPLTVVPGQSYFFMVTTDNIATYFNDTGGTQVYVIRRGGTDTYIIGAVPYYKTWYGTLDTFGTYTDADPTTGMLLPFMSIYQSQGGVITASSNSVVATSLSLTAQFNTNTVLQGITEVLALSPSGFYWYIDLGTDILYFLQASTTADIVLTKGLHMNSIKIAETIEYIVNSIFFTGGADAGNPGYNIYTSDSDANSIAAYRRRLDRPTDNNVIDAATAHSISLEEITTHKKPANQSVVTVMDKVLDIYSLHVGQVVGFNGFGNFADSMLAQIVRIDFKAEAATLTLGILPKRIATTVEQNVKQLIALQTVSGNTNPASPS